MKANLFGHLLTPVAQLMGNDALLKEVAECDGADPSDATYEEAITDEEGIDPPSSGRLHNINNNAKKTSTLQKRMKASFNHVSVIEVYEEVIQMTEITYYNNERECIHWDDNTGDVIRFDEIMNKSQNNKYFSSTQDEGDENKNKKEDCDDSQRSECSKEDVRRNEGITDGTSKRRFNRGRQQGRGKLRDKASDKSGKESIGPETRKDNEKFLCENIGDVFRCSGLRSTKQNVFIQRDKIEDFSVNCNKDISHGKSELSADPRTQDDPDHTTARDFSSQLATGFTWRSDAGGAGTQPFMDEEETLMSVTPIQMDYEMTDLPQENEIPNPPSKAGKIQKDSQELNCLDNTDMLSEETNMNAKEQRKSFSKERKSSLPRFGTNRSSIVRQSTFPKRGPLDESIRKITSETSHGFVTSDFNSKLDDITLSFNKKNPHDLAQCGICVAGTIVQASEKTVSSRCPHQEMVKQCVKDTKYCQVTNSESVASSECSGDAFRPISFIDSQEKRIENDSQEKRIENDLQEKRIDVDSAIIKNYKDNINSCHSKRQLSLQTSQDVTSPEETQSYTRQNYLKRHRRTVNNTANEHNQVNRNTDNILKSQEENQSMANSEQQVRVLDENQCKGNEEENLTNCTVNHNKTKPKYSPRQQEQRHFLASEPSRNNTTCDSSETYPKDFVLKNVILATDDPPGPHNNAAKLRETWLQYKKYDSPKVVALEEYHAGSVDTGQTDTKTDESKLQTAKHDDIVVENYNAYSRPGNSSKKQVNIKSSRGLKTSVETKVCNTNNQVLNDELNVATTPKFKDEISKNKKRMPHGEQNHRHSQMTNAQFQLLSGIKEGSNKLSKTSPRCSSNSKSEQTNLALATLMSEELSSMNDTYIQVVPILKSHGSDNMTQSVANVQRFGCLSKYQDHQPLDIAQYKELNNLISNKKRLSQVSKAVTFAAPICETVGGVDRQSQKKYVARQSSVLKTILEDIGNKEDHFGDIKQSQRLQKLKSKVEKKILTPRAGSQKKNHNFIPEQLVPTPDTKILTSPIQSQTDRHHCLPRHSNPKHEKSIRSLSECRPVNAQSAEIQHKNGVLELNTHNNDKLKQNMPNYLSKESYKEASYRILRKFNIFDKSKLLNDSASIFSTKGGQSTIPPVSYNYGDVTSRTGLISQLSSVNMTSPLIKGTIDEAKHPSSTITEKSALTKVTKLNAGSAHKEHDATKRTLAGLSDNCRAINKAPATNADKKIASMVPSSSVLPCQTIGAQLNRPFKLTNYLNVQSFTNLNLTSNFVSSDDQNETVEPPLENDTSTFSGFPSIVRPSMHAAHSSAVTPSGVVSHSNDRQRSFISLLSSRLFKSLSPSRYNNVDEATSHRKKMSSHVDSTDYYSLSDSDKELSSAVDPPLLRKHENNLVSDGTESQIQDKEILKLSPLEKKSNTSLKSSTNTFNSRTLDPDYIKLYAQARMKEQDESRTICQELNSNKENRTLKISRSMSASRNLAGRHRDSAHKNECIDDRKHADGQTQYSNLDIGRVLSMEQVDYNVTANDEKQLLEFLKLCISLSSKISSSSRGTTAANNFLPLIISGSEKDSRKNAAPCMRSADVLDQDDAYKHSRRQKSGVSMESSQRSEEEFEYRKGFKSSSDLRKSNTDERLKHPLAFTVAHDMEACDSKVVSKSALVKNNKIHSQRSTGTPSTKVKASSYERKFRDPDNVLLLTESAIEFVDDQVKTASNDQGVTVNRPGAATLDYVKKEKRIDNKKTEFKPFQCKYEFYGPKNSEDAFSKDRKDLKKENGQKQVQLIAECLYNPIINVLDIVVKPVNLMLWKAGLKVRVTIYRNPCSLEEENQKKKMALQRKQLNMASPGTKLSRNIIEIRASNPPFNTTVTKDADDRYQRMFAHTPIL